MTISRNNLMQMLNLTLAEDPLMSRKLATLPPAQVQAWKEHQVNLALQTYQMTKATNPTLAEDQAISEMKNYPDREIPLLDLA